MKLQILALMAFSAFSNASEMPRKWTDTKGRSIEGTLVSKTETAASVQLASGKTVVIPLSSLDEESKSYVVSWVKDIPNQDLVSARVVGSGNGKKTIEVAAKAGKSDLEVRATSPSLANPITRTVKAGQSITFKFQVEDEYTVTGSIAGEVVDTEDSRKKTGLH